jgi:hypothetical protein
MDKQTFFATYDLGEADLIEANISWEELARIEGTAGPQGPAFRRLKSYHIRSIPQSYTPESKCIAYLICVISGIKSIDLGIGRGPVILKELHTPSSLGIDIDRTALIQKQTQGHMAVFYSGAAMTDLIAQVRIIGNDFRNLKGIASPEKTFGGLRKCSSARQDH